MPCPLRSRCTAWQVRGALCKLGAAAHTPCDVVPLTSPPPVSVLLSAALLPQTQVSYPATLPYSKQTNSTHPGKPILALPLRAAHAAESRDPNPGREEEQLLLASHLPAGSRACRMVDVAIPALPCIKELPRAPFLPSPLLSPCPPPAPPVRSAAAPARAPNALTTAVGLIIKITF